MSAAPPRYLMAHLGDEGPDCRAAFLRFPPGVTMEDAWRDFPWWRSPLPPGVVGRLRGLGVEVVAVGREAVIGAALRAMDEGAGADVGAFAEDYLDVNARLGGGRCVTVDEYAMDTKLGERGSLVIALWHLLVTMGGVRMYGGAAFREGELPDALRLRVRDIALRVAYGFAPDSIPCLLHCDRCRGYGVDDVGDAIWAHMDQLHRDARVAVPRRLLDQLAEARDSGDTRQAARALLGVVARVFQSLPGGAWDWGGGRLSDSLASLVALAAARTCEEHRMLTGALRECRSLRQMVRRARDASWVASRTLESLMDRW